MYIEMEATSNVPWYKWDSFAVIDGYTCFFNNGFTSNFVKNEGPLRRFEYCCTEDRQSYGSVFEWRYKVYLKNLFLAEGCRAIVRWSYNGKMIITPTHSEAELSMKYDLEKRKRMLKFIEENLIND